MTVKPQTGIIHDGFIKVERTAGGFEIVRHPGAVCIVAYDDTHVYLVKQFRPAVGDELMELPAGTLEEGEDAHDTAMRELGEEINKGAKTWTYGTYFYSSPGYTDERVLLLFATDLFDVTGEQDEGENIEVVKWSLNELDIAIKRCDSVKCKIGLMMLKERLARPRP